MAADLTQRDRAGIEALFAELGLSSISDEDLLRFHSAHRSVASALARFPRDLSWSDEPAHSFRATPGA